MIQKLATLYESMNLKFALLQFLTVVYAVRIPGVSKLVVGVAVGSNWGSGILLSRDRILTCAHVVTKLRSSQPL
jgi:hypothetical protein